MCLRSSYQSTFVPNGGRCYFEAAFAFRDLISFVKFACQALVFSIDLIVAGLTDVIF